MNIDRVFHASYPRIELRELEAGGLRAESEGVESTIVLMVTELVRRRRR